MGSSTAAEGARIGSTIAGKYRLHRKIGAGSIGAVYAAVHQFTGKHVALKLIDGTLLEEHEGFAARFLREARAAADIGHPVICDVLDAGQEPDGTLYLALELLEGRTFEDAIEADDLRLDEVVDVGIELLDGLAAAHDRGIVHRDIKPENVFLTWNEQGEMHVKLLDFGVAKNTKGGPELYTTQQGAILGTPWYMAPEQAAGDPVDARADIWSVGAVLFHALTGDPPHDAPNYNRLIGKLLNEDPPKLRSVRRELPEWLCTAVDGALQRDPDVRWQSARTMAETLRLKGRGEIELDWELHEDATVRTNSPYDSGESARPPALAMISVPDEPTVDVSGMQADSVEVDLEQLEPETLEESSPFDASIFDSAGGATIKSDVPPPHVLDAILAARGKPAKSRLWTGVLLGVVITLLAAAAAGWFVYERYLLPEAAPPVETPPAPVG